MQFEYRTMAAFVLAVIVDNFPKGQVSTTTILPGSRVLFMLAVYT